MLSCRAYASQWNSSWSVDCRRMILHHLVPFVLAFNCHWFSYLKHCCVIACQCKIDRWYVVLFFKLHHFLTWLIESWKITLHFQFCMRIFCVFKLHCDVCKSCSFLIFQKIVSICNVTCMSVHDSMSNNYVIEILWIMWITINSSNFHDNLFPNWKWIRR